MAKSGKRNPSRSTPATGVPDEARRPTSPVTRRRRKADRVAEAGSSRRADDPTPPTETVRVAKGESSRADEPALLAETVRDPAAEHAFPAELVGELASCLWYLKTKYFRRKLDDEDNDEPDPRARHALRRIGRSLRALGDAGIRLVDPTGTRYPPGGEAMMIPLQFEPTAGMAMDTVSETVTPMVFSGDRLIQRGEVFVSVPVRDRDEPDAGGAGE
jgi:hypothetical protein